MNVYKFGGASVKDAAAIQNLERIINNFSGSGLIIVVSAMAKTTNALEKVVKAYFNKGVWQDLVNEIKEFHYQVIDELFQQKRNSAVDEISYVFELLESKLNTESSLNFNFEYDQVVSFGEILSTTLIGKYLNEKGILNQWLDARKLLRTNSNFREADVNWELSTSLFSNAIDVNEKRIYITQGFIGSDNNNSTTTLGREGSDFTAAAIAYMLDAESLTVWKDVPGVLNADPKYFSDTIKLDELSYLDAIELAYFGTSVIHPKTIQPLQQKEIPLFVKSFVDSSLNGTLISKKVTGTKIPCFIVKPDQRFIHIATKDFSFIVEAHLEEIFRVFAQFGLRMNIMQNSAVSFDVCVNNDETRVPGVITELEKSFHVRDEKGLELITIRHYDENTVNRMLQNRTLILEQKTKENIQLVTSVSQ